MPLKYKTLLMQNTEQYKSIYDGLSDQKDPRIR